MCREEFTKEVVTEVKRILGDDYEVDCINVNKNNGQGYSGITIIEKGKTSISPVIRIEAYYDEALSPIETAVSVCNFYCLNMKKVEGENMDLSIFTDYEKAKDRLSLQLLNRERNKDIIEKYVYKEIGDLVLVLSIQLEVGKDNSSAKITKEMLNMWDIDKDEVFNKAFDNFSNQIVVGFIGMSYISNKDKYYGASSIFVKDILKDYCEANSFCGLYIIPSSIHECLLFPAMDTNFDDADEFTEMIKEVNKKVLEEQDILSDHVYFYSLKDNALLSDGKVIYTY